MAEGLEAQLRDIQRLLREGRPTEADIQINALATDLQRQAEKEKSMKPPPGKRTLVELQMDFADTVCDLLGNPPRLTNLLVEIKGEIKPHSEQ